MKIKQLLYKNLSYGRAQFNTYFSLGYMHLHVSEFDHALDFFHVALTNTTQQSYHQTTALKFICLTILLKNQDRDTNNHKRSCSPFNFLEFCKIKQFFSGIHDSDIFDNEVEWCHDTLKAQVKKSDENIDFLWLYLSFILIFHQKMDLSLNLVDETVYKIKQSNAYYGYLALCYSSLWLNGPNVKSKLILQDLIKTKPQNFEAYVMLWNYYFKQNQLQSQKLKDQQSQKDLSIAKKIYHEFKSDKRKNYVFVIIYAKTLYKHQLNNKLYEFLFTQSQLNPTQTIYLFLIGKYISRSANMNHTLVFQAQDALEECKRRSDQIFHDKIKYFQGKLYQIQQEPFCLYLIWSQLNLNKFKTVTQNEINSHKSINQKNEQFLEIYQLMQRGIVNDQIKNFLKDQNFHNSQLTRKIMEILIFYEINMKHVENHLISLLQKNPERLDLGILLHKLYKKTNDTGKQQMLIENLYNDLENYPTNQSLIFEISKIYAKLKFHKKQYNTAINVLLQLEQIFCKIDYTLDVNFQVKSTQNFEQINCMRRLTSINHNYMSQTQITIQEQKHPNIQATQHNDSYNQYNRKSVNTTVGNTTIEIQDVKKKNDIAFGALEYHNKENLYLKSPMRPRLQNDEFQGAIQSIKDSIQFIHGDQIKLQQNDSIDKAEQDDKNSAQEKIQNDQIFTDTQFLYLIGKYTQLTSIKCQSGLDAIDYYINQQMYQNQFKYENNYQKKLLKAKYRKGLLLIQLNRRKEGITLLKSILIDLFQFNQKGKLKKVQVQILINKQKA